MDNDSHYQDCRIDFDIHSQLENDCDYDSHSQNLAFLRMILNCI